MEQALCAVPLSRETCPMLRYCKFLLAFLALTLPIFAQEAYKDPDWKYTFDRPDANWFNANYDDSTWATGAGGFGNPTTPGSRVGSEWNTKDIWMRRTIELNSIPDTPALLVHHDEDLEVYINGKKVLEKKGFITNYQVIPLGESEKRALQKGENLVAVYCHQTGGGQFVDVHVVDAQRVPNLPKPRLSTTPFQSHLITQWGEQVTPENAWREYPRPHMVRKDWTNLNGTWEFRITPRSITELPTFGTSDSTKGFAGKILVPFPLESKLSGVQRKLLPDESLWYRRELGPIIMQPQHRAMLHFEAVDYRATIYLNGKLVGSHTGGNTAFSVDITDAIAETNELVVRVDDDTEAAQLRGKQVLFPAGIWYTQVSGIWQSVWMEVLPVHSFRDLKIRTDVSNTDPKSGTIVVKPLLHKLTGANGTSIDNAELSNAKIEVKALRDGRIVGKGSASIDQEIRVPITAPEFWTPDTPTLYDLEVFLFDSKGNQLDTVQSYAALRSVGKVQDASGHWRMTLNGEVIFHFGPLDQGWWPDGLLTPPSEEAMVSDITFLKSAGFNMIRKHIKVEPRRYYYHCDRVGMLVWQDQVSGGAFAPWTRLAPNPKDAEWKDEDHRQFLQEFEEMVTQLEHHPSIVVWTPFNEAWGQHRTLEVGDWIRKRDTTRLINIASGGNFLETGDIADEHNYPHPAFPIGEERWKDYIKVVGEFGGHGWVVPGHLWDKNKDNWGYGGLPKTEAEYRDRYRESIRILADLKQKGIAAGVYTQTTDVEGEVNGLLTYDRRVPKIPAEELRKIHAILNLEDNKTGVRK